MSFNRRHCLKLVAAVAAGPSVALSPAWPNQPLRLVVPYAPGGPTDILARLIAPAVGDQLGQAVMVENVPGAGGNIGMAQVARAAPDGRTLAVVAPNVVINPLMYAKAGYDPAELVPVTVAVRSAVVASVHPSLPVNTLRELVDLVQAQPGRHAYASPGIGTPPHLVAEQWRLGLGLDLVHVPYASAGQAVAAALAAQVPIVFSSTPPAIAQISASKLRALAVTGAARDRQLPGTPTMAEAGYSSVDGEGWFGFVVPAATPTDTIAALFRAISAVMGSPALRSRLPGLGFEPVLRAPDASAAYLKAESAKWAAVIRRAGIRAE